MSDAIARGVVQVGIDGSEVTAGIAPIKRSLDDLGSHAVKTGQTASDGLEKAGDGAKVAATNVDSATRNMIAAIQRQIAATEAGSKSSVEYYKALASQRGVNAENLTPYLNQLDQVTQKQRMAAAAAAAVDPAVQKLGMSAKQTAFAMRGLPAQMTDIIVSLQGGQRPMTVLMQQGGQLKDMFGGIGNAAKAMGTYIASTAPMLVHPFTLAAAAAALYGKAVYDAAEQSSAIGKALISSGNAVGMTKGQLIQLADEVGKLTGKYSLARDAAVELAASGQFSGAQIKTAMQAAVDGATVTGKSIQDMTEALAAIGKDPVKGISDLNEKYNFLTQSTYAQIKALQDQGREQEAVTVALNAFADTMSGRRDQIVGDVGYIQAAWMSVKKAIDSAQSSLLSFGRDDTLEQKIKKAKANLAEMEGSGNPYLASYIENEKAYIAQLENANKVAQANAKAEGEKAQAQKEGIEGLKELEKFTDKYKTKQSELNKLNEAWSRAQKGLTKGTKEYSEALANYNRGLEQINKKYTDKDAARAAKKEQSAYETLISSIKSKIEANQLEIKTGLDATEAQKMQIKFDTDLASGKLKLSAAHKAEAQAQLAKLANIEKENRQKRFAIEYDTQYQRSMRDMVRSYNLEIDTMGLSSEAAEKLATSTKILAQAEEAIREGRRKGTVSDDYAEQMRKMAQDQASTAEGLIGDKYSKQRDPWFNASESIRSYGDEASNVGKQIGDTMTNAMKSAEDAWVQFATTGKLSFSSLATSIIADLARIQAKKMISSVADSLGGSVTTALGGSYSESGWVDAANYISTMYQARAEGGPVTAGTSYLVGEKRPEIFTPSVSGYISPNASGSGGSIHFAPVYQIDARADRAAVLSDMQKISRRSNAELVDTLQRKGMIA